VVRSAALLFWARRLRRGETVPIVKFEFLSKGKKCSWGGERSGRGRQSTCPSMAALCITDPLSTGGQQERELVVVSPNKRQHKKGKGNPLSDWGNTKERQAPVEKDETVLGGEGDLEDLSAGVVAFRLCLWEPRRGSS